MGGTSIPRLYTPITTAATQMTNDFGFIFVKWVEVETRRPFVYAVYDSDNRQPHSACVTDRMLIKHLNDGYDRGRFFFALLHGYLMWVCWN